MVPVGAVQVMQLPEVQTPLPPPASWHAVPDGHSVGQLPQIPLAVQQGLAEPYADRQPGSLVPGAAVHCWHAFPTQYPAPNPAMEHGV
jgi:hypothetical protein